MLTVWTSKLIGHLRWKEEVVQKGTHISAKEWRFLYPVNNAREGFIVIA